MKEPYILQKIAELIRECPTHQKELENYYKFISTKKDRSEIKLLEYLIEENRVIRFHRKDLTIDDDGMSIEDLKNL